MSGRPAAERLRMFRQRWPEQSIAVDGTTWRYRTVGSGQTTLVLLPGGELVNDLAFDFASRIADQGGRVLYPAYSARSGIQSLIDGLASWVRVLGATDVAVLGGSFGGMVAQLLVRRHPALVDTLILSNVGVPQSRRARQIATFEGLVRVLPWSVLSPILRASLVRLAKTPDTENFWRGYFEELFASRVSKADVLRNIEQQREWHSTLHFGAADLDGWDGRILLIESDSDPVVDARSQRLLESSYQAARVHVFSGAGHTPILARPFEYARLVGEFIGLATGGGDQ